MSRGLEGIKVPHISRLLCSRRTMYLAYPGAEVIKIEPLLRAVHYACKLHAQKGRG